LTHCNLQCSARYLKKKTRTTKGGLLKTWLRNSPLCNEIEDSLPHSQKPFIVRRPLIDDSIRQRGPLITMTASTTTRYCRCAACFGLFFLNLDWSPFPHFCPLEALQPVCNQRFIVPFPLFLIVPTLAARCLSRPQPAVVP
jgi:hypothetical protein